MIFGCIPHRVLGRIFIFVLLLFFFLSFFPSLFIYLFIYFSFERWNFLYRSFQQVVSRDYFSGRFQTWRFIYFISSYFFLFWGCFNVVDIFGFWFEAAIRQRRMSECEIANPNGVGETRIKKKKAVTSAIYCRIWSTAVSRERERDRERERETGRRRRRKRRRRGGGIRRNQDDREDVSCKRWQRPLDPIKNPQRQRISNNSRTIYLFIYLFIYIGGLEVSLPADVVWLNRVCGIFPWISNGSRKNVNNKSKHINKSNIQRNNNTNDGRNNNNISRL